MEIAGLDPRYQCKRLLGTGGSGKVYLARDTVLERDVAIKLLTWGADDVDGLARQRFHEEARIAQVTAGGCTAIEHRANRTEGLRPATLVFEPTLPIRVMVPEVAYMSQEGHSARNPQNQQDPCHQRAAARIRLGVVVMWDVCVRFPVTTVVSAPPAHGSRGTGQTHHEDQAIEQVEGRIGLLQVGIEGHEHRDGSHQLDQIPEFLEHHASSLGRVGSP